MIMRLWSGWTSEENADAYHRLLIGTIAPAIAGRRLDGLADFTIWRRAESEDGTSREDEIEFLTCMTFSGWDAVAAFTGGDPHRSVVPAEARALLSRFDEHSRHYELGEPVSLPGSPAASRGPQGPC